MKMSDSISGERTLRTACYARFSTDLQRATSIDDQVRECRETDPNRAGEFLGWRIEVDPAEADTIREVFGWYAAGMTFARNPEAAEERPLPSPTRTTVRG